MRAQGDSTGNPTPPEGRRTPADALPPVVTIVVGFVLLGVFAALDYLTKHEMELSVFYLVPIAALAWFNGRWVGIACAVAAAVAWAVVIHASGRVYTHPLYYPWNIATRFLLFPFVAIVLPALRKALLEERKLARTDHLTGAVNSRSFMPMVQAEVDRSGRYKRSFSLAYIDLDDFKSINDAFGHSAGDALLKTVVAAIRGQLRSSDVVARLGGDEFGILLPEADQAAARVVIAKIRAAIAAELQGAPKAVTVSIGCVTVADGCLGVEEAIRRADDLMYRAKMGGKDDVSFSTEEIT